MTPPRASPPPRGPPPRGPPPRGSQGGVDPEARSSAVLSAENMSQIQGLIASALQAERTQHEADMTVMRDQLAQVKKDLATAEVRIDDRSALGTAEEARIANVVSTALVASSESRYRGQVSPKLPIGFITCMEEHPFDPSRMVYLVRKIQETLYSIVGAPHLLSSPFSYESYVYGNEFILELHQELFKDLDLCP